MKRVYIAADDDPLECSMCDQKKDLLVRLPIKNWADPRGEAEPWIGICESCTENLLLGFVTARERRKKPSE